MKKLKYCGCLKILMLNIIISGCGYHRPTLINNVKSEEKVDLTNNGILAFEINEPENVKVDFEVREITAKQTYQLNQVIDNGSAWRIGIGPWTIKEKINLNKNENRYIYLYEIPPGEYQFNKMTITTVKCLLPGVNCSEVGRSPKINSNKFNITKSNISYVGSIELEGKMGFFTDDLILRNHDRSDSVIALLQSLEHLNIKSHPVTKNIVNIELK